MLKHGPKLVDLISKDWLTLSVFIVCLVGCTLSINLRHPGWATAWIWIGGPVIAKVALYRRRQNDPWT